MKKLIIWIIGIVVIVGILNMPIMFNNDKILFSNGKVAMDENCCCGGSDVTCSDCTIYASNTYEIASYVDGDLSACSDCDNYSTGDPWDGSFTYYDYSGGVCTWYRDPDFGGRYINGKLTEIDNDGKSVIYLRSSESGWTVHIACQYFDDINLVYQSVVIWEGNRTTTPPSDCGPVGVYNRTGGCDTTASLTIVQQ